MKAIKVFNNNAVSTSFPDKGEAVLIGLGVGFNKRPGDSIDETKVEKIYYIQNDLQTKFLQLLKDTRPEALEASEAILEHAREQGLKLKNQLILSLTDHISFALEREEQGIELPYLMMSETKMLYPKEFEIARWALDEIEKICHLRLPDYEAGYISLQLVSSSMNRDAAYNTLTFVRGALNVIKEAYGVELDNDAVDTMRLITHLKFLAQRIFTQAQWTDDEMGDLREILMKSHPRNQICLEKLKSYIWEEFQYELNDKEEVYILVHLTKIFKKHSNLKGERS